MLVGKKTYMNKLRELLKGYESFNCDVSSNITEQFCLKLDDFIIIQISFSKQHGVTELHLVLTTDNTKKVLHDVFQLEIFKFRNVYDNITKNEFSTMLEFEDYLNNILSYINPTYIQVRQTIQNYITKQIANKKPMKRLLEDAAATKYISEFNTLTPEEIDYLYNISGNEQFLPQEAKDIFLF